jgi:hypothetical protein
MRNIVFKSSVGDLDPDHGSNDFVDLDADWTKMLDVDTERSQSESTTMLRSTILNKKQK